MTRFVSAFSFFSWLARSRIGASLLKEFCRLLGTVFSRHSQVNFFLGDFWFQQGRLTDAYPYLRAAQENGCTTPRLYVELGLVLAATKRFTAAEAALGEYVRLSPFDVTGRMELGNVLVLQEKKEAAANVWRKVLRVHPENSQAHASMGEYHLSNENPRDAETSLSHAVEREPHNSKFLAHLAKALTQLGRLEEAKEVCQRLMFLNPENMGNTFDLAHMGQLEDGSELEKRMRESTLSPKDALVGSFAMANWHLHRKNLPQAFEWFTKANNLMRKRYMFNIGHEQAYFQRVQQVFDADFFRMRSSWGNDAQTPVFILGMPRSGTTLVEQILASHPQCHGGGERLEIYQLTREMGIFSNRCSAYPEVAEELDREVVEILGRSFATSLEILNPSSLRVTDKMPANFLHVGLIHLMLPKAHIIHCRRDPMDTCLSCYLQFFVGHHPYAYNQTELGQYYRLYDDLMRHWRQVLPGRMLEVHYEELIAHPQREIGRILEHCQLPWDPACLNFHSLDRPVATASYREVRQPMYSTSIGRWHQFESQLEPLRQALGIKGGEES